MQMTIRGQWKVDGVKCHWWKWWEIDLCVGRRCSVALTEIFRGDELHKRVYVVDLCGWKAMSRWSTLRRWQLQRWLSCRPSFSFVFVNKEHIVSGEKVLLSWPVTIFNVNSLRRRPLAKVPWWKAATFAKWKSLVDVHWFVQRRLTFRYLCKENVDWVCPMSCALVRQCEKLVSILLNVPARTKWMMVKCTMTGEASRICSQWSACQLTKMNGTARWSDSESFLFNRKHVCSSERCWCQSDISICRTMKERIVVRWARRINELTRSIVASTANRAETFVCLIRIERKCFHWSLVGLSNGKSIVDEGKSAVLTSIVDLLILVDAWRVQL